MFAAVVCPRCRKGFAVDLEHRTSSCPHCGRQVRTGRMRARFTSPSAVLTAQAVAELNRGGRALKGFHGKVVEEGETAPPLPLEELVKGLGEFDVMGLEAALRGRMDAEEALRRLLAVGMVYEVSPGRYRMA